MSRSVVLASASSPQEAAVACADATPPVDLIVVGPTALAREAAAVVAGGRWIRTVEEPLLAPRGPGESGDNVLWRLAKALRVVHAHEAAAPLVLLDGLDVLGASAFVLDEDELMRFADELERLLPLP